MIDIHEFVGMLPLEDGREVWVDNVSNGGWSKNSLKGATFLSSPSRICRLTATDVELVRDVLDACDLYERRKRYLAEVAVFARLYARVPVWVDGETWEQFCDKARRMAAENQKEDQNIKDGMDKSS